jgi:hypothetical protein
MISHSAANWERIVFRRDTSSPSVPSLLKTGTTTEIDDLNAASWGFSFG